MPAFHASVEGIAGAKSKLSPDRTGENHLPLAGNAGLHGKSILPREGFGAQDWARDWRQKEVSTQAALPACLHLAPRVAVLIGSGILLFLIARRFARKWEYA
jgi:hypothetical protein